MDKELPYCQRIGRIAGTENDYISVTGCFQREPAGEESVHEDVAEFGVLRDKRAQILGLQFEHRAGFDRLTSLDRL